MTKPKIIFALGNPGSEYLRHRHNIGRAVLEAFVSRRKRNIVWEKRMMARACSPRLTPRLWCVEPQTYMNRSGLAVAQWISHEGLKPSRILVVYDDCALPLGQIRIRLKGSSGGHNGIESIIQEIGTSVFPRMRLGIGPCPEGLELSEFVLSDFTAREQPAVERMTDYAVEALSVITARGLEYAMNMYNRKGNDLRL